MFVLRFITAKVVDLFTTPNFIALKTLNKLLKIEFEGGTRKEPNVIGIGTRNQKLRVQSGSRNRQKTKPVSNAAIHFQQITSNSYKTPNFFSYNFY